MKDTSSKNSTNPQYATASRKKFAWHSSFAKKDNIIRNIEIITACVIAFIAGAGLYGVFN